MLLCLAGCATLRQPPLPPPGISSEEEIMLGGQRATIFIRGKNRANPVLLDLHGGPGIPSMPFSHLNAELENDFTVVHWDQRGAGKSYRPGIPRESMTIEAFVRDTEELTRYLRARFHQPKIYLTGFSWGSLIGILAAAEHPEYYKAYIGISQLVDVAESDRLLFEDGIARANERGLPEIGRELQRLGPPPYEARREERRVDRLAERIRPQAVHPKSRLEQIAWFLQSPYYGLGDVLPTARGMRFSNELLHPALYAPRFDEQLPRLEVPVWFFLGRHDTILSPRLGESYFRRLIAPRGKHLVWFEHSAHAPQLEEPARFREELRRVLRETRSR